MTDAAANSLPDDDRRPEPAAPTEARPDWLVSSDQGASDELRARGAQADDPEALRLTTSNDLSTAVPVERPKLPARPGPEARPAPEKPAGPKPWTAAASSVPKLKVVESAAAAARHAADARSAPAGSVLRAVPEMPSPAAARPAGWDDERSEEDEAGFPEDTGPTGPVAVAPPRKLDEPLWVVALDALRSNRQAQLIVAAAVLLPLLAWTLWPRSEPGVSLHALRQEPGRWDGQVVRIQGRVGEVFHVGAGWAYNLHQGRDTIVVFTRGPAPRIRDKVSVAGSVSTGYLDGQPRQAIFAVPDAP